MGVSGFDFWDLLHRWIWEIEQESKIFTYPRLVSETKYPFLGTVKKAALALPDCPKVPEIIEIAFIDELETFVGKKIQIRVIDNC